MRGEYYKGKKVIWESKLKRLSQIAICFLFTATSIATYDAESKFLFLCTFTLFGIGGLFMLIQLLNPKNIFVTHKSVIGKELLAERERLFLQDIGLFTYDENGFSRKTFAGSPYYLWTDVQTIFGYKADLYTTDEIHLDIFLSNGFSITLDESVPGWFQFNEHLIANIPDVPKSWYVEISVPAFETNLTLLFDRHGRTFEEAVAAVYKK